MLDIDYLVYAATYLSTPEEWTIETDDEEYGYFVLVATLGQPVPGLADRGVVIVAQHKEVQALAAVRAAFSVAIAALSPTDTPVLDYDLIEVLPQELA